MRDKVAECLYLQEFLYLSVPWTDMPKGAKKVYEERADEIIKLFADAGYGKAIEKELPKNPFVGKHKHFDWLSSHP